MENLEEMSFIDLLRWRGWVEDRKKRLEEKQYDDYRSEMPYWETAVQKVDNEIAARESFLFGRQR